MPASPSFPSDSRSKWKKRKRDPQVNRRQKQQDADDDDEDEQPEEEMDREDDPEESQQGPDLGLCESEVLLDGGVRISDFPSVIRHSVNRPHSSVLEIAVLERANSLGENRSNAAHNPPGLENVSYGQLQALSTVPADSSALDQERADGSSSYVISPPPIMEGRGVVKRFGTRVHVVPMHSEWFSPSTVNRLERQVVPHFFSGKSSDHTPEKYMECRNFVVAKYMENPELRLTVSDFQGLIGGIDNEDLTRIVRFLDQWGIINYCVSESNIEHCNAGSSLREDTNGELHVPSDALKSVDSLIKFDKPKCRLKASEVYSSVSAHDVNVPDLDSQIRERLSENHCNCCSQPLHTVYYQSHKEVDVLLCPDCFHEGKFVIGHCSIDFVKVDTTKDYGESDIERWTDQETLMLLEAMEIYNDNWNEIAEHVGTKTKAQCIHHFVSLPIEDGVLDNIEVPSMSTSSNSLNGEGHGRLHLNSNGNLAGSRFQIHESESRFPFANSGNPVMSLVAFLASAIGPRVAAACAHASLAALSEDGLAISGSMAQIEGTRHGNRMNLDSIHDKEGSYGESTSLNQNQTDLSPLSAEKVKAAAKAGLAAAATKAKLFADHEEREIQRLSANIINHQLKRLELKLKQFAEVETMLMKECEQVEKARQRFAAERNRLVLARFGPAGNTPPPMSLPGLGPSMVNNNANNRPQVMSTSPLQPSNSVYGNNQTVHPHMSFSPQQPMFGFGPRLPMGSLQASSSAVSNVNFNSPGPGNPQTPLNHPMLRPVSGTTSSGLG